MSKILVISIIFLLINRHALGQVPLIISGVVRNDNGENLSKTTLLLVSSRDTLKTISNEDGSFRFTIQNEILKQSKENLELWVTMRGYKDFHTTFIVKPNQRNYLLPPIVLSILYKELVPVMVMSVKPVTIVEDTVEYHAGAYQLRAGAELERLMRRLPGIDWDKEGNLMIEGKKISRVMINSQDYTGSDMKTALSKLPADIVDKVQVIDDYGDKARLTGVKSSEGEKVLNIVTKKDHRNGGIANLDASIGDKGRYKGILFSEILAGDRQWTINSKLANTSPSGDLHEKLVELTYADKWNPKWSGNAHVSVWGDNHSSSSSLIQDNYFAGSQGHLEQSSRLAGNNQNELFSYAQLFTPDANTKLRVNAFLGIYHNRESLASDYTSSQQDSGFSKTGNGHTLNLSQTNSLATGSNFYYEKINPHNKQRMSIEASYRYNSKKTDADDSSLIDLRSDSLKSTSIQHYLLHTDNSHRELTTKLNYYFPLGKLSLLEFGYAWNYSSIRNDLITQVPDSAKGILATIDSLSNYYTFTTMTSRLHAGFLTHAKNLNLTFGLDAQPANQQGETIGKGVKQAYHYFNILPLAQLSYSFSATKKINFEYDGSSAPPSLQQLQPVTDISNPQYPVHGNPNLKPSYTNSVSLRYEQSSLKANQYWGFSMGLNYKTTSQAIITNQVHPQDTSSIIQQTYYVNASGFYSLGADYRLDLPSILNRRVRISAIGNISETQDAIMTDNTLYKGHSLSWNQGLQFSLNIPDIIESELEGGYSYSQIRYSAGNGGSYSYPSFNWSFHNRQGFFQKWVLEYDLSQTFTSAASNRLQGNPALLNASIQRDIFPRNQARISFYVNDLLNASTGITQSVGSTGITQNRTALIGRYFLLSIIVKMEKFR